MNTETCSDTPGFEYSCAAYDVDNSTCNVEDISHYKKIPKGCVFVSNIVFIDDSTPE